MANNKTAEVIELATILVAMIGPVKVMMEWASIPEIVPTHFNALGLPDAQGPKAVLGFVAVLSIIMYFMLTVGQHYPGNPNVPWKITDENREETMQLVRGLLTTLKLEVAAMFSYVCWTIVAVSQHRGEGLGVWFLPVVLVAIFGTIIAFWRKGAHLGK